MGYRFAHGKSGSIIVEERAKQESKNEIERKREKWRTGYRFEKEIQGKREYVTPQDPDRLMWLFIRRVVSEKACAKLKRMMLRLYEPPARKPG